MAVSFKGMISRALAAAGTFLLTLSGQTSAMPNPAQDKAAGPSPDDWSRQQRGEADRVTGPDGRRVTVDQVENEGKVRLAAHVNSGPTTHTNVPGHADFTRQMKPADLKAQPGTVQQQVVRPGGAAAAHVNSGPTTHTNVPGHADFTRQMQPGQLQTPPGQVLQPGQVPMDQPIKR